MEKRPNNNSGWIELAESRQNKNNATSDTNNSDNKVCSR